MLTTITHNERLLIFEELNRLLNQLYKTDILNCTNKMASEARAIFIYVAKTNISQKFIDKYIGWYLKRDRTTIVHNYKKVKVWVKIYDDLAVIVKSINEQLNEFITKKINTNEQTN